MGSLTSSSPRFEAAMDVDVDGASELIAVDVFHNDKLVLAAWSPAEGDLGLVATAEILPGYLPDDVVQGDFDGDGRSDLAITWSKGSEPYWLGEPQILSFIAPVLARPGLTVTESPLPTWAGSTDAADMDGDGDWELVIAAHPGEILVMDWRGAGFVETDTLTLPNDYDSTLAHVAAGGFTDSGWGGVIAYASHESDAALAGRTVAVFSEMVSPPFLGMIEVSDRPTVADYDADGLDDVWDPLSGVYLSNRGL